MKKFNFAALLPGFLALNNSVWASDSSTGASDLPGMTLNEHDLVIAHLTRKYLSTLQGIVVIAPIEAIVLIDLRLVVGTMVEALLIILKHTVHQAHQAHPLQVQIRHRLLHLFVRFALMTPMPLRPQTLLE